MMRLLGVVLATIILAGCAGMQTRSDVVTITPPDQSWTLRVPTLARGNMCGVGFSGAEFSNNGQRPLGGSFIATVLDSGKTRTLGELNLYCQTAFPGGSASCTSAQTLTFPCQQLYISAKPMLFPR